MVEARHGLNYASTDLLCEPACFFFVRIMMLEIKT